MAEYVGLFDLKALTVGHNRLWIWLWLLLFLCGIHNIACDEYKAQIGDQPVISAIVNITYKDPRTGEMVSEREEIGRFGVRSRLDSEIGWVVHVRTTDNRTHGCSPPVNVPVNTRWIALIQRGSCKFTEKIYNAAVVKNASAVVIYNDKQEPDLLTMEHNVADVVSIFIKRERGEHIASLVDNGTKVFMQISVGREYEGHYNSLNKTSVLFVSISFIVLMIISLAWLVFYYIQRFRYAHAKERLCKRLMHAAKKAVTKMAVRTIKNGDKETESDFDQCAVCIEGYRVSEVIRILPCKHVFHKSCVDPWLIEQRSCPMCKMDILKAYGLQVHGSRESCVNMEVEGPSTSVGPSEMLPVEAVREFDSDGVEVIHFQPGHIEYHDTWSRSPQGRPLANETAPHAGATFTVPLQVALPLEDKDDVPCGGAAAQTTSAGAGQQMALRPVDPDCHVAASGVAAVGAGDNGGECCQRKEEPSRSRCGSASRGNRLPRSDSVDSLRSVDSDSNELQSLMPESGAVTEAEVVVSTQSAA